MYMGTQASQSEVSKKDSQEETLQRELSTIPKNEEKLKKGNCLSFPFLHKFNFKFRSKDDLSCITSYLFGYKNDENQIGGNGGGRSGERATRQLRLTKKA